MHYTRSRSLLLALTLALALLAAACGNDDDAGRGEQASAPLPSEPAPTATPEPTPTSEPTPEPTPAPTATPRPDPVAVRVAAAEEFRSTFYSFDADALAAMLGDSPSAGFVLFYQGWAEGANYGVLDPIACEATPDERVRCSTTVEDDLLKALQILDFNVTDTFTIAIDDEGDIGEIVLTSDDPDEVGAAFGWVFANRPELFENECQGFFEDGPTPTECAVSFVAAMADSIAEAE